MVFGCWRWSTIRISLSLIKHTQGNRIQYSRRWLRAGREAHTKRHLHWLQINVECKDWKVLYFLRIWPKFLVRNIASNKPFVLFHLLGPRAWTTPGTSAPLRSGFGFFVFFWKLIWLIWIQSFKRGGVKWREIGNLTILQKKATKCTGIFTFFVLNLK
jgi:hypothetical protein